MGKLLRTYTLTDLQEFVREAQEIHSVWRQEAWVESASRDGAQWSQEDYDKAVNAGIDPLTINRLFPTIEFLVGTQIVNRYDMITKGRTQHDTDMGQTMTEGIRYIHDQCEGDFLISGAHRDALTPGLGWLMVNHNNDPRKETIRLAKRDWKEMWWDPYASPWLDVENCRYVFQQRYTDVENLIYDYPDKAGELEEYTANREGQLKNPYSSIWYDEAQQVEDFRQMYGGRWNRRRRVRPVEIWYPLPEEGYWATFPNGDAMELDPDKIPPNELFQICSQAQAVVKTNVRKMYTTVFLDNIMLKQGPTPFNHDEYPYVPFVGYTDRYGFPFGALRQLMGQQTEINKRRSMMMALVQKRRVIATANAADKPDELQKLYLEANKIDGFMVLKNDTTKFEIVEGTEKNMMNAQVMMYHESEREIDQIGGVNQEMKGNRGQALSGIAQEKRIEQGSTIIAPLFNNLRRSLRRLGALEIPEIQGQWKGPKILRITDRMTGSEKFVALNEVTRDKVTGAIVIKNNVTQGKFDMVVSEAPATDTVRESNMNLLIEWAKKSPPEMIPYIMHMAMELSNLPNKDLLLSKLEPLIGLNPGEQDMSEEERKQKVTMALQAHQAQAQKQAMVTEQLTALQLENARLENEKLKADIAKVIGSRDADNIKAKAASDKVNIEGFKVGADTVTRKEERKLREYEVWQKAQNEADKRNERTVG